MSPLFVSLSGCTSGDEPPAEPIEEEQIPEPAVNETVEPVLPVINVTEGDPTFVTVDGTELLYIIEQPNETVGPDTLVLFAHGNGHSIESYRNHTKEVAGWGVTAAAINYRDNDGFPAFWGAQDLIAAREHLHANHGPFERTILFAPSMGVAVSGTALAESDGLFDVWFAIEGVTALYESWAEACAAAAAVAFAAQVCTDIERDAGRSEDGEGTPCGFYECPDAFMRRSPLQRVAELDELQEVFVVHALYDGLVPWDQSAQLVAALRDQGITTHFTTVLRGEAGTEQDTTPASHALGQESAVDQAHGLSGHGSEKNREQAVIATAYEQLEAYIKDGSVLHGAVVDRR